MNPKEPPVYEYVKFVGDFKFHNHGKDLFFFLKQIHLEKTKQKYTYICTCSWSHSAYVVL